MAVFSSLKSSLSKLTGPLIKRSIPVDSIRMMSGGHHRVMGIEPSRFQWKKTKDLFHFYAMLGVIPLSLLVFYANVYVGPARLAPIPEGYEPQHWEYHKHPITRWMARYIFGPPQQNYEKYLHQLYEEDEKMKINLLIKKVKNLMTERHDYQAFYYYPVDGKYHRIVKKQKEANEEAMGVLPTYKGPFN